MTGAAGGPPRVAWLSAETPDRFGGGGPRRQYHQIRALVEAGIDVRAATLAGPQDHTSLSALAPVLRFGRLRLRGMLADPALDRFLGAGAFTVAVVAHIESVPHVRRALARHRIPWLLDLHNVNSRFHRAHGERLRAAAWRAREIGAVRRAAMAVVCSREERAALSGRLPGARIDVAGHGVDPAEWPAHALARERPPTLGLVGSWHHGPNRQGAEWLGSLVWPAVRRAVRDARLLLAGPGRPPEAVLARDGVEHVGRVGSLAHFLGGVRVAVVPIVDGIGARMKFGESLASGAAVVATPEGAEGFDAEGAFVAAAEPDAFARACVELLVDAGRAAALGRAGRALALERLGWPARTEPILQFVRGGPC